MRAKKLLQIITNNKFLKEQLKQDEKEIIAKQIIIAIDVILIALSEEFNFEAIRFYLIA